MCWHQDTNDWTVTCGPQGAHQVLQEQGWGLNLRTNLWPGGPPTALRVNNALTSGLFPSGGFTMKFHKLCGKHCAVNELLREGSMWLRPHKPSPPPAFLGNAGIMLPGFHSCRQGSGRDYRRSDRAQVQGTQCLSMMEAMRRPSAGRQG